MNYVILNDREIFENEINLYNFHEVDLFGDERIDAVFCHISKQILENINNDPSRRDEFLPGSWLLKTPGIFVLSKIDRNILYDEQTELIETMLGFFDQEEYYIEIRGYNRPESYNQIDQFIIVYHKSLGNNLVLPDNIETENFRVVEMLLQSIKETLL